VLKELDEQKFETNFTNFKNKYTKFDENDVNSKKVEAYLENLYSIRKKWAYCYVAKTFSAGYLTISKLNLFKIRYVVNSEKRKYQSQD